ncbi:MAG: hypothetical protein ABW200_17850 [Hyphomicrobiaceae bacterium]
MPITDGVPLLARPAGRALDICGTAGLCGVSAGFAASITGPSFSGFLVNIYAQLPCFPCARPHLARIDMLVTASGLAKADDLALVARRRNLHDGMVAGRPGVLDICLHNLSKSKLGCLGDWHEGDIGRDPCRCFVGVRGCVDRAGAAGCIRQ